MICIFVNPRAGKGKSITLICNNWNRPCRTEYTIHCLYRRYWPETLADAPEAWIAGGDGTLNYFINHFKDIDIPLPSSKAEQATILHGSCMGISHSKNK